MYKKNVSSMQRMVHRAFFGRGICLVLVDGAPCAQLTLPGGIN